MMGNYEIPVYLFTGFLGSGKTTFLQDLLDGSDFNDGQSTLVLLFEEGEVELKPENFASPAVYIEQINRELGHLSGDDVRGCDDVHDVQHKYAAAHIQQNADCGTGCVQQIHTGYGSDGVP